MQSNFSPPRTASRLMIRKPQLQHGVLVVHGAIALVVIVLVTLTLATMESFLAGDQSLSARHAVDMTLRGD